MRINVTGNAGSGKSTLSRQLSRELDLPLIEMDRLIWEAGWQKVPKEQYQAQLAQQLQQESWVLDGVAKLARQQADLIIFLDYPRRVCAWRCAKRNWRYLFRSRPGLPEGCLEWQIVLTLAKIIMDFPSFAREVILKDIAELDSAAVIIEDADDLAQFYARIPDLREKFRASSLQAFLADEDDRDLAA